MLTRRHPHAVHSVYARDERADEPGGELDEEGVGRLGEEGVDGLGEERMGGLGEEGVNGLGDELEHGLRERPVEESIHSAQPRFAASAQRRANRRRLPAMALLGAVVGIVAMLLVHGLRSPGVGGEVGSQAVAVQVPHAESSRNRESGESGSQSAPERRVQKRSAPAAGGVFGAKGVRAARRVGGVPKVPRVGSVPVADIVASAPAVGVVRVAAADAAGSEFDFER
jgi:hypothetical protein